MPSHKVTFDNAQGQTLSARLNVPDGSVCAYALFAHCFTCSKDLKAVRHISQALQDAGIAVLSFDFTGLGASEGDFAETSFSSNVEDLLAAAAFLKSEFQAPQLLIGHSLGGAAVLMAARRLSGIRAVITVGAPAEPEHVRHLLRASEPEIQEQGEAEVSIAGRSFRIKNQFLEDLEASRMADCIAGLRAALLIMHSPVDNVVGVDNARQIFELAKHPKSFISLNQADHLLTGETDAKYAASVMAAWVKGYLPEVARWQDDVAKDAIVVRTGSGYRTEVRAKGFDLLVDEPAALGGTDAGPNPYDYLAVSLAACKSLTLRMYADRKKLPVDAIEVTIQHSRKTKPDDSEGEKHDHFDIVIDIQGELDTQVLERMLEISGRCPVHRTLDSEILYDTRLKT